VVPGITPVRIPLDEPIVATAGVPLLQVPPGATSLEEGSQAYAGSGRAKDRAGDRA
jgi:hypothetical protein